MRLIDTMRSTLPEGEAGIWRIERFEVDKMASAISLFSCGARAPKPGVYTRLMRGRTVVMSDTPAEISDHYEPWRQCRIRGGRILINGLGLGAFLGAVLRLDNITHIDVVEVSRDVIDLVGQHFTDPRLHIHHGDALTFSFPRGIRWSVAWHDIWDNICGDNLPDMHKLHRRYGRRCDWQGSWARYLCERGR